MTPAKSLSLTVRLALLFACVAAVTFALVGAYLYRALDQQLARRDDSELIGKVMLVRHLLQEAGSIDAIEQSPNSFLDAMVGHEGLTLRLQAMDGHVILKTEEPSRPLPPVAMVDAHREPVEDDIHNWRPKSGDGRIVGAIGLVGSAQPVPVQIIIAIEETERALLLNGYGKTLILSILLGAFLAAALGFATVRLGLRPLKSVVAKANAITTHRLDTRLRIHDAPAELSELGAAFNAMLDRLEEGVNRLSRFSADLAHDLRTPINTLMMETQVALAHPRSVDEYQALLASNIEEYERLARMIENTLFLARAENAQLALNREELNVRLELERIRDYFEGLAEEAEVTLTVDMDDGSFNADPMLFQRAVSNLLQNAIQQTPRGGIVRLSTETDEQTFKVIIEDTGPGISPEHLPHIFDRYYRADASRQISSQSTGLGLAIVRAIMRLHGGRVTGQSEAGQNTRFSLIFNRARPNA